MDNSILERKEITPAEPWSLIADDEFGLREWLKSKSQNPDTYTVSVSTNGQISIIKIHDKEPLPLIRKGITLETDLLLLPSGEVLGVRQHTSDLEADTETIKVTIPGEKIITYELGERKTSLSPFNQGKPRLTVCFRDKETYSEGYPSDLRQEELLALSTAVNSPNDVEVGYDFDSREGTYTPVAQDTRIHSGQYKIYHGVKGLDHIPAYVVKVVPEDISELADKFIASWPGKNGKFQITVEVPKSIEVETVSRIAQTLNAETDWLNLPREMPVISYSMSSNQLPEK